MTSKGTSFDEVISQFINQISDYELEVVYDLEVSIAKCVHYLKMAIGDFTYPRISLEYDAEKECFINKLTMAEINVLVFLMQAKWLEKVVFALDRLDVSYKDKDFQRKWGKVYALYEETRSRKRGILGDYSKVEAGGRPRFHSLVGGVY